VTGLPLLLCNPQIVRLEVERRPDRAYRGSGFWGLYGYDASGTQVWGSAGYRTKRDANGRKDKGCMCTKHFPQISDPDPVPTPQTRRAIRLELL
jgi:hypothetical protein